jgi:hypothetical protein
MLISDFEQIEFDSVMEYYYKHSSSGSEWEKDNLTNANREFGAWIRTKLPPVSIREVVMPFHTASACGDRKSDYIVVPPEGMRAGDLCDRIQANWAEYEKKAPKCFRKVKEMHDKLSLVDSHFFFFSGGGPPQPEEESYRSITGFPNALFHIDGLHRVIGMLTMDDDQVNAECIIAVRSISGTMKFD